MPESLPGRVVAGLALEITLEVHQAEADVVLGMDIGHAAGLGEAELLVQGDRTLVGIDDIGDHRLHVGIVGGDVHEGVEKLGACLLYTSPSPRD